MPDGRYTKNRAKQENRVGGGFSKDGWDREQSRGNLASRSLIV
jgi:hypothetical protein